MLCKKIINCKKWLAQIKKITDLPCFFANFVTCKDMVMKSPFFFLSGKSERFDLSFFCCPHKETGLHIVQKIYKMTTILNQKQILWPFFTENLVKMKILNTFNFSFLSLRNRRYKVFRFLYIGQGLCPGMQIIQYIWPSRSWYIELSREQDELVHLRVVSKMFLSVCVFSKYECKKNNKIEI